MSRFYQPITQEAFEEKVRAQFELFEEKSFFSLAVEKDLKKVGFDFENFSTPDDGAGYCDYPQGFQTLGTDLRVFFASAGGDWEFPVCYLMYWDGKAVRGYVPDKGNIWHRPSKSAFGNQREDEEGYEEDDNKHQVDASAIVADVLARIQPKKG